MSNCYLQFSATPIPNLTDEEITWIEKYMRSPYDHEEYPSDEKAQEQYLKKWHEMFLGVEDDDLDYWPSFSWKVDRGEWWIYCEESCNTDHIVSALQAFLAEFRPKFVFQMTYANTCSKMLCEEFGGGWLVVTATGWDSGSTYDAVSKAAKRMTKLNQKRLSNPKSKYWRP